MTPRYSDIEAIRRQKDREVRQVVLDVIRTRKRLTAKDRKRLRNDILAFLVAADRSTAFDYLDICRALDWLCSKRKIKMIYHKKGKYYDLLPE